MLAESVDVFAIHKDKDIRLFKASLSASPDHNFILNTDGDFLYVNKSMSDKLAIDVENILGKNISEINEMKENDWKSTLSNAVANKKVVIGETSYEQSNEKTSYEFSVTPVLGANGVVEALIVVERDITDRKSREETAWHKANFDHLTELPNRNLFLDRLDQQIKHNERSNTISALFFIDLDHFKEVNDDFGHDVGDYLLQQVANRISACVRKNVTVARIGGDEFTVILTEFEHISHVEKIADKIIIELANPFQVLDYLLNISGSIGISFYHKMRPIQRC